MYKLPIEDFKHIDLEIEPLRAELLNSSILITGATGFFGTWMLESLLWIRKQHDLNCSITIVTRNKEALFNKSPYLKFETQFEVIESSLDQMDLQQRQFTFVFHLSAGGESTPERDDFVFDNIVLGTRNLLKNMAINPPRKFLFVSSGGAYGKQSPEINKISEEANVGPDTTSTNYAALYGEAKRAAELLTCAYARQFNFHATIARCFAFVGPLLPLKANFAIGNFIHSVLTNEPIHILGDGTPMRSYLYAGELVVWLWNVMLKGENCKIYNVGSEHEISIKDLALKVKSTTGSNIDIMIKETPKEGVLPDRYIPSVQRMKKELGCVQKIDLEASILKTVNWYKELNNQKQSEKHRIQGATLEHASRI